MDITDMDNIEQKTTWSNDEVVCRACLQANEHLINLYMEDSAYRFTYCTTLEVNESDGYPGFLCKSCHDAVNQFYTFKQLCFRSDTVMKYCNVKKSEQNVDEYEIKIEQSDILDDFADSNDFDSKDIGDSVKTASIKDGKSVISNPTRRKKSKRINSVKIKSYELKPVRNTDKREQFVCETCNKKFYKEHNLKAHMRVHFGKEAGLCCDICKKFLKNYNSLKVHMFTHTGVKNYKCPTCKKKFQQKSGLALHELIHSGIKKFICHVCGMKCLQSGALKIHMLRHTGEKPLSCNQCDRKFRQMTDLTRHMIRHEGVKNHACTKCPYRFYFKFQLDKHLLTHTELKPYACDICGKTFKTQSFIAIHRRTHTGERPFKCDFCPDTFMASKELRNHRMIHTGEKPYKCKLCTGAFIQKGAFNRHMKIHIKSLKDDSEKKAKDIVEFPSDLHTQYIENGEDHTTRSIT